MAGRNWLFPGPRRHRLDQSQVISALGLSGVRQLKRLIKLGRFPPAIKVGSKGPFYWLGSDVAAFLYFEGRGCGQYQEDGTTEEEE